MEIALLDSTLREGEQSPHVSFTIDQKVKIVQALDTFGIEFIEIGHPAVSPDIQKAVKKISQLDTRAEKIIHGRATRSDIDGALSYGVPWVGIFFGTSALSLKHKFGIDQKEALIQIVDVISYAKDKGLMLRFTAEDASRTELSFLIEVAQRVETAGADRFSIADTVGVLTPEVTTKLVTEVKAAINIPIHIHCHNDLGLATANVLAAFIAGASVADVSINGLGERCGIASLAEVALILKNKYHVDNNWDLSSLRRLAKEMELISGISNRKNQPIVGDFAFTHKSGLHTRAVIKDPKTYESYCPKLVGQNRNIIIDKFTGTVAVADRLNKLKIKCTSDVVERITSKIKSNPKPNPVTDLELINYLS
jgi:2-isopropylmalate synthase